MNLLFVRIIYLIVRKNDSFIRMIYLSNNSSDRKNILYPLLCKYLQYCFIYYVIEDISNFASKSYEYTMFSCIPSRLLKFEFQISHPASCVDR